MPTATQDRAQRHVDAANEVTREIERAEREHKRRVEALKKKRRREWLRANRAGRTYDQLVAASGVSDGYLCRQVQIARSETSSDALRARPGRSG